MFVCVSVTSTNNQLIRAADALSWNKLSAGAIPRAKITVMYGLMIEFIHEVWLRLKCNQI
ncbi:hypothetical protein DM784_15995 [Vibrio furnissii]|nr:hypothetical protein DM784_15995 [Vibrio furnissii]